MSSRQDPEDLLSRLDLKEYEVTALQELLTLGRTTAPNLSEATGIPKARIYDVLETLADYGFIKIIPGRPKEYQPKPPAEILDRATENHRQDFAEKRQEIESIRDSFIETFETRFEQASSDITPTEELFWVVDVGEASERETRTLYTDAQRRVNVFTKSFEYIPAIEGAFQEAIDRGIDVDVLFVHPDHIEEDNTPVQESRVRMIEDSYPEVDFRVSEDKLPWRGTLADPSMEYDTGKAIFLVEETDIPLHLRQAAITDNGSFVAGMNRLFELIWEYDSLDTYPDV